MPQVDIKTKVSLLNSTGVSKMVPVEDSSETETAAVQAQHQVSKGSFQFSSGYLYSSTSVQYVSKHYTKK